MLTRTTPYQRIVVTQGKRGARLYLNGNLQFAQSDEYRYHEALVHPVMSRYGAPRKVAVFGGGDGMAVREVLKYPSVESVTLVELDPQMTDLFKNVPSMQALNSNALNDPKVHIVNADAFQWLQKADEVFDVIIVDFPRSDQLCRRQALHQQLLRDAQPAPGGQRFCGDPDHLAADCTREFLDRGDHR